MIVSKDGFTLFLYISILTVHKIFLFIFSQIDFWTKLFFSSDYQHMSYFYFLRQDSIKLLTFYSLNGLCLQSTDVLSQNGPSTLHLYPVFVFTATEWLLSLLSGLDLNFHIRTLPDHSCLIH